MKTLVTILISLLCFAAAKAQVEDSITNGNTPNAVMTQEGVIISCRSLSISCEYPGGMNAFYNLFKKSMKKSHLRKAAKANTRVTFMVGKDGSMTSINTLNEPNPKIKEEIVNALALGIRWSPGIENGSVTTTMFDLPVVKK